MPRSILHVIGDGTSSVGEGLSVSWLWWIPAVLVGLVVVTYVVGTLLRRALRWPKVRSRVSEPRVPELPEARANVRARSDID